ncbi:hypothetical protein [Streptomyces hundungensis]|uniref:hypothetical protein n=1 Tax=Streptomyces hundungensis TaxID=1077946 RepID=UPI003D168FE6
MRQLARSFGISRSSADRSIEHLGPLNGCFQPVRRLARTGRRRGRTFPSVRPRTTARHGRDPAPTSASGRRWRSPGRISGHSACDASPPPGR